MRTRQEIKAIGKDRFKANYWPCVGAYVLVMLAIGAAAGITFFVGGLAGIILGGPLEIGLYYFFVQNILGQNVVDVGTPFTAAFQNFGRKLGGYLWMVLFVFLWSCLFWIPGIIKGLSYAMTPYILSDCPNVRAKDALKLSMRIMAGHKWELFVFELSFIGWMLLDGLTSGLLGIFYVSPYMQSSLACYYLEVREEALRTGVITMGQLEGVEAVY